MQDDSPSTFRGHTIAVVNQKGGVGKTTTAVNLGAALALMGHRTLVVDADPQGNMTSGLGLRGQRGSGGTIYDALVSDVDVRTCILPTEVAQLFAVPSDRSLTGAEIELVSIPERERRLSRAIRTIREHFEFVIVDCPPSLGLLTLNALVAADAVLIPLHCEYFALEGLADLVGTLKRVRSALNPRLDVEGVLLTMYDDRTNLGQLVARDVREYFREKVFNTIIPRNVRLGEAPSHGKPGVIYDPKSRGAAAYFSLAKEVVERHQSSRTGGNTHHG